MRQQRLRVWKNTKSQVNKPADRCCPKTLTSQSSTLRTNVLTADSANVEGKRSTQTFIFFHLQPHSTLKVLGPSCTQNKKLINLPHDPNHDSHRPKSDAMTCIKARSYESTLKCAASRGLGIKYLCYSRLAKLKVFLYSALCRHAHTHARTHIKKTKQKKTPNRTHNAS